MKATVKPYKNNLYAIHYGDDSIKGAFGGEPISHESKKLMEYLAEHISTKEQSEKGFALDEPYATLYYILSWLPMVKAGTDPVSDDPHWEISCDPVFHLESGPPMIAVQMAAYQPVIEWLENMGASHTDLPLLYISTQEAEENAKSDENNYIGEENSQPILDQWNSLTVHQKAAGMFLQYHIDPGYRHSLCGATMLLKGLITEEQFAEICCAAGNISPYLGDVSEEMFQNLYTHFQKMALSAQKVVGMLDDGVDAGL